MLVNYFIESFIDLSEIGGKNKWNEDWLNSELWTEGIYLEGVDFFCVFSFKNNCSLHVYM